MKIKTASIFLLMSLFLVSFVQAKSPNFSKSATQPTATPKVSEPMPKNISVKIETSLGIIEAKLYASEAPRTVQNFTDLVKKGFYDGLIFHRVIPDFMIQTGDPEGTGFGGPGYKFPDEFSPGLRHDKLGMLSMANSGPNTNGSQFFITAAPTPWLDNKHTIFGQVTSGQDIVTTIANTPRDANDKPLTPVAMKKVTLLLQETA